MKVANNNSLAEERAAVILKKEKHVTLCMVIWAEEERIKEFNREDVAGTDDNVEDEDDSYECGQDEPGLYV